MKIILFLVVSLLLFTFITARAANDEIIMAAKASSQAYNVDTVIGHVTDGMQLVQFYKNPKGSFCKVFQHSESNKKTLIVAYRGSASDNDWINNFNVGSVSATFGLNNEKHGKVHEGFMVSYKASRAHLFSYLTGLLDKLTFDRVIFTGHSQGGAVAMLSIYDFLLHYPKYSSKIELITFGQPRVGQSNFIEKFKQILSPPKYTRLVTIFLNKDAKGNGKSVGEDLVSQVPPPFLGFKHAGSKVNVVCTALSITKCHDMNTYLDGVKAGKYVEN